EGLQKPSKEELMQVVKDTEKEEVKALTFKKRPKKLIVKEPDAGKIVSETVHEATKVTSLKFENGVCMHHKHMDFNKDNVTVTLNFSGGKIEETAENQGISNFATIPLHTPATSKLTSIDIQNIMTGKNVRVGGGAGEDKVSISISGTKKDLEQGLRLAHILIRDAKIEPAVFNLVKQQLMQSLEQYKSSVDMQLMDNLNKAVTSNDPRFAMLTPDQLETIKIEAAQAWLDRILKQAPIEGSIVGDISLDEAKTLVNKYFGSLPARSAFGHIDKLRELTVKREPVDTELKVDTKTPKSLVLVGWRGPDYNDKKDRQCMILAAKILSSRLHEEIREKKQLTYSAFSQAMITPAYKNKGLLFAYFTADKTKARKAADLCKSLIEELTKTGPTEVETTTVLKQIKTDIQAMIEKPSYWSSFLSDMNLYGKSLNDLDKIMEIYMTYTKEDIHDVLKKYISRENSIRIIALPK
ncbi:MAG: insulinase family protein, partial [Lentisphaeraceae bacterium]|nr:insulinase family protein [Lentisphaeraceae bacterium]